MSTRIGRLTARRVGAFEREFERLVAEQERSDVEADVLSDIEFNEPENASISDEQFTFACLKAQIPSRAVRVW